MSAPLGRARSISINAFSSDGIQRALSASPSASSPKRLCHLASTLVRSGQTVEPKREITKRLGGWGWTLLVLLALAELGFHLRIRAAVPLPQDWEDASTSIRAGFQPGDRIVASPPFLDPLLRHHLGDLLTLRTASRDDFAGAKRLWELSLPGRSSRDEAPELTESFGRLRLRRWPLRSERVVYDFVERLGESRVQLDLPALAGAAPAAAVATDGGEARAAVDCPWTRGAGRNPGGLGRGPMEPAERFVCDLDRPWLWVGATVMEDLGIEPRRCVWQHPAGREPVRVTYEAVPMGQRLVVHAGLFYLNERERFEAPVQLRIWIDDVLAAEISHEDGDGWARYELDTSDRLGDRAEVRFEASAEQPYARSLCWAASSRVALAGP